MKLVAVLGSFCCLVYLFIGKKCKPVLICFLVQERSWVKMFSHPWLEAKGAKLSMISMWETWHSLPPVSNKVILANHGHLWACVCSSDPRLWGAPDIKAHSPSTCSIIIQPLFTLKYEIYEYEIYIASISRASWQYLQNLPIFSGH